jgi:hypothetical protein
MDIRTLVKKECVYVPLILAGLICAFFPDIVFMGYTLSTIPGSFTPGVMPDGPYGYKGYRRHRNHVTDAGSSAWGAEPQLQKIHQLYFSGQIPLWNANQALGMPLAGDTASAVFFPLRLLPITNPSPAVWDLYVLFRFFWAGLFAYLYFRLISLAPFPSLIGAIAFMFNGHFVLNLNWGCLDAAIMTSFAFFCMELMYQRKSYWTTVMAGVALASIIFAGMPAPLIILLVFAASYYLFRSVGGLCASRNARLFCGDLLRGAAAYGVGVLLSLVFILPSLEFVSNAFSYHSPGDGMTSFPFSCAITNVVPFFYGRLFRDTWADPFTIHALQMINYIGVVPFFLFLFSSFQSLFSRTGIARFSYFFTAAAALMLLKTHGCPVINWIGSIPFFNLITFWKYLAPFQAFSVAVGTAIACHYILSGNVQLRAIVPAAVILVCVIAGFVLFSREGLARLTEDRYEEFHFAVCFSLALVIIAAIVVCVFHRLSNLYAPASHTIGRGALVILAALLVCELFSHVPKDHVRRYRSFKRAPYIRFLQEQPGTFRIYGVGDMLYPNMASAFGLYDIRTLSPLNVRRYVDLITQVLGQSFSMRYDGSDSDILFRKKAILDLLGVKYVISTRINPQNIRVALKERAGYFESRVKYKDHEITLVFPAGSGKEGEAGRGGLTDMRIVDDSNRELYRLVYRDKLSSVFENEHALPRAFIVHRIKVIDPCHGQEALTGMKSENFQPAKIAFIEGHIPASLVEALERVPEATGSRAEIKEYRDNRVCIQATMDYPGFLILSDIYYPGWKVIVDGKEGKIYPADYLLRGVFLERGAHTIKFVYSPASFKIGASVGVLVLLSLLAIPFFRKRNARLARG